MISTTFVQFQTSSSFPKFSKKSLLPAFNLTCLLTHYLLLFSLLTGSFILLKLLFLKSTMTSSLRWIVVRSLHSFFSTYLLPLILSIIPSFLLVFKIGSVLMVCLLIGSHLISSHRSQAVSINDSYLCILYSFLWRTPRFRTWPTPFHSLYNSSWLGDLKKFPQISLVRWWHPAVHLFHSYNFCSISWNTYYHFQWHSLLDELEQTASQSIKNWISSHWHKTTASQIFWSNKLISQQWYHPSQFLCSQSWLHLWLWHVFLWSNQLCIQILSFSYPRHPSNSSSSSSFYSHCSCKFTCFQQTWLLQFTLLWHLTNKSQQTSTHFKIHWHVSLQILQNINTSHQHSKNYTGFLSNKESTTKPVFSHTKHLQINNLHIFTIVFHSLHILFLHDLLIRLFFPFHMFDHHLAKGLSLSSVHASGIHSPWYPKLIFSTNIPFQTQNTPLQNRVPSLGSFPSPLDCLPGFWFLLFSFYALSNDT